MKKLMTMLAAVATAFGLYAADTGFISGAGFDTSDTASPEKGAYTWLYDTEASAGDFDDVYWTGTGKASIINEKYTYSGTHPVQFDKDNTRNRDQYLKIDSGTDLVSQRILPGTAKKMIGADGLYFDGLVQFTSYEDEAPAIDDGAKIALFPMVDDPEAETPTSSLWISAAGNSSNLWKTAAIQDGWHRVTIKMINNIYKTGAEKVGFVVYIDGSVVSCAAAKIDEETNNLTSEAKHFNKDATLFVSLGDSAEMQEVAFSGKGAIDEIAFTETAPDFAKSPKYYTITWDATVTSVNDLTAAFEDQVTGEAETYTYVAASGYISGTTNITGVAGATYTITAAKLGASVYVKQDDEWVVVPGGQVSTFADALAKVGTDGQYKIVLGQDADVVTLDTACDLTIDLAGNEIASIMLNVMSSAKLTIVDSSEDQSGSVAGAVSAMPSTTLFIEAGIYDGTVTFVGAGNIKGGKFKVSSNTKTDLEDRLDDSAGLELVEEEGYYVVKAATGFTVTVPEKKANTKLAVTIDDVDAGETNGVYTVVMGSTLKAVYTADEGYELEGAGEFTITYATKGTVITAPTAKQIMVDFTIKVIEGADLLAVSNGNEQVEFKDNKYTVPTNATVTLYYAPDGDYRLAETTAEVQITTADQVVDVSSKIKPAQITYVAQIGDDGAKFETLKEAVEAAQGGDTINILANCDVPETICFYTTGTNAADQITLVNNHHVELTTSTNYSIYIVNANVKVTGTGDFSKTNGQASAFVVGSYKSPGESGRPPELGWGVLDFEGNLTGGWEGIPASNDAPSGMIKVEAGYCNFVGGSVINWRHDGENGKCVTASGNETNGVKYVGLVTVQAGTFKANTPLLEEKGGKLNIIGNNNTAKVRPLDDTKVLDYANFCEPGYTFLKVTDEQDTDYGWYKIGMNTFEITVTDGESAGAADPATFTVESDFPLQVALNKPTAPEGKLFASWSVTAGEITGDKLIIGAFTNGDVIATVNYTNKQVTATFVDQDETTKVQTVDYGFMPEAPEATGKDGYTFTGWNPAVAAIKADTTFTAQYTATEYNVTFAKAGDEAGDAIADITYTVETQDLKAPECTWTLTDYTFDGWTNTVAGGAVYAAGADLPKTIGGYTLTATWKSAAQPVDPVEPGKDIKTEKTVEEINADPALKAQLLKAPEGATVNPAVYNTYFDAASGSEAGTVKFELNATGEAALKESANTEIVKIKPDKIADATQSAVEITDAIPGFYYAVKQGNGIGQMKVVEAGQLATGSNKISLNLEKYEGAGFYQVVVSEKPIPAENKAK